MYSVQLQVMAVHLALSHAKQPQAGLDELLANLLADASRLASLQQTVKAKLMLSLQTLLAALPLSARKPALRTLVQLAENEGVISPVSFLIPTRVSHIYKRRQRNLTYLACDV